MFASGKFSVQTSRVVLFGCVFVCLLSAKGFPPLLPGTGERGSSLHLGCWAQTTCTPTCTSQMAQGHKTAAMKFREPPVSYLQTEHGALWNGTIRRTTRSSRSVPMGFMQAEGISAFLSLVNPICSLGPAPAGHLSIFFHPSMATTWAELTVWRINSGFLPTESRHLEKTSPTEWTDKKHGTFR